MQIVKIKTYKFDELSVEAQDKAIEEMADINVDFDWWHFIYEDAANIGLKLTEFDLDRNRHTKGEFTLDANQVIEKILANHNENCPTYQTAKKYQTEFSGLNGEADNDRWEDLSDEFLQALLEDYAVILQEESEYLMSREAIVDTIRANEYDFLDNGSREFYI